MSFNKDDQLLTKKKITSNIFVEQQTLALFWHEILIKGLLVIPKGFRRTFNVHSKNFKNF